MVNPLAKKVSASQLGSAIRQDLSQYSDEIGEGIRKSTRKAMRGLVKATKETAPVGRRKEHYKEKIASRTEESTKLREIQQWYVKRPDYRLTHLLDHGHKVWNGRDYKGTQFVTKAEEKTRKEHQLEVERIIKNGH